MLPSTIWREDLVTCPTWSSRGYDEEVNERCHPLPTGWMYDQGTQAWSIDRTSFGLNYLVTSPLTTTVIPFLSSPCSSSSMTSVVRISVAEHVDCFVDGFRQAFCWSRAATLIHSQVDRKLLPCQPDILYCISQIAYCTALLDQDGAT